MKGLIDAKRMDVVIAQPILAGRQTEAVLVRVPNAVEINGTIVTSLKDLHQSQNKNEHCLLLDHTVGDTLIYMGSTLVHDRYLDTEVIHGVWSGWNDWKMVAVVLCDRNM